MSRQTIHRIYTENKRRATMVRAISKQIENFTLQPTAGYYRSKPEKSIRAGNRGGEGIAGQMAGGAYSRNKSASFGTGEHLERAHQEDYL
jgi:hypothetical protein